MLKLNSHTYTPDIESQNTGHRNSLVYFDASILQPLTTEGLPPLFHCVNLMGHGLARAKTIYLLKLLVPARDGGFLLNRR